LRPLASRPSIPTTSSGTNYLSPGLVCSALRKVRARLKNPPKSVDEYLAILTQQGLVATVADLEQFADLL